MTDPKERIAKLMDRAHFDMDNSYKIKWYLRKAQNMIRMICAYIDDSDLEPAFILSIRVTTLLLKQLPLHPGYNNEAEYSVELKAKWKKKIQSTLSGCEILKSQLTRRYQTELEEWRRLEEETARRDKEMTAEKEKQEEAVKKRDAIEQQRQSQQQEEEAERRKNQSEAAKNDVMPPSYDRALKPEYSMSNSSLTNQSDSLSSASNNTTNKYNFKTMNIPRAVVRRFLECAAENTRANRETCAILCGRLQHRQFHVSHAILPKQTGGADSCQTSNEEELFGVVDGVEGGLITLGWIHTHPTQTAFLSSVDLHTQLSYQLMVPEAVALVCAPRFDQLGVFSLTPNHGLDVIRKCRETGFHPHAGGGGGAGGGALELFETATHVRMLDEDAPIEIIDLRYA